MALTKAEMVHGVALALYQTGDPAADITGLATPAFLAATRKTWKANGYTFSDTDVRAIHDALRRLVAARATPTVATANPMGPAVAAPTQTPPYQPGAMGQVTQDIALPNEFGRSPANPAPEVVDRRALAANLAANTPRLPTAAPAPGRVALTNAVEGYHALTQAGGR